MFKLGADLKVYLHREPIDFRAGINSLAVLVQEVIKPTGLGTLQMSTEIPVGHS
ncbi:hypothetical protein ACC754_36330 [Rhizobium johnstonii]|uniref:hypothetical protein n=1 Tax=Rhizobium johnstonii TaxID=3019933 RepID=UPI003F946746